MKALNEDGFDFAYVHVEAPDEMGHQGNINNKIQSIEYLDQEVIRVIKEEMEQAGAEYRMLILPDHPTPIAKRTHTADPVPYMLYDSRKTERFSHHYNEREAANSGHSIEKGYQMIEYLFGNVEHLKE